MFALSNGCRAFVLSPVISYDFANAPKAMMVVADIPPQEAWITCTLYGNGVVLGARLKDKDLCQDSSRLHGFLMVFTYEVFLGN